MSIRLPSRIVARAAYVSRPTLRVKTLTRGRAPLCQIVKKKSSPVSNFAATRGMCQIMAARRAPCQSVKFRPAPGPLLSRPSRTALVLVAPEFSAVECRPRRHSCAASLFRTRYTRNEGPADDASIPG